MGEQQQGSKRVTGERRRDGRAREAGSRRPPASSAAARARVCVSAVRGMRVTNSQNLQFGRPKLGRPSQVCGSVEQQQLPSSVARAQQCGLSRTHHPPRHHRKSVPRRSHVCLYVCHAELCVCRACGGRLGPQKGCPRRRRKLNPYQTSLVGSEKCS